LGGFHDFDRLDLAFAGLDGGDLFVVPRPAVEDVQDLPGKPHGGARVGAGGGDPVHGEPAVECHRDAEFFAQSRAAAWAGDSPLSTAPPGRRRVSR